ncbi:putative E3 ubiquitin-protein ligase MID2 [Platysternon megacephalum]|uniref:Putative E3 ubiquitin-protein ligase MID2 n=1 Tax=Platysternon megacephalum TaxID=55544 RepID=A0A4D9E1Z9_9SAUR|nr:putative E3 ubiquitin-protein ligase MID2 [Platysternon megacephalum]
MPVLFAPESFFFFRLQTKLRGRYLEKIQEPGLPGQRAGEALRTSVPRCWCRFERFINKKPTAHKYTGRMLEYGSCIQLGTFPISSIHGLVSHKEQDSMAKGDGLAGPDRPYPQVRGSGWVGCTKQRGSANLHPAPGGSQQPGKARAALLWAFHPFQREAYAWALAGRRWGGETGILGTQGRATWTPKASVDKHCKTYRGQLGMETSSSGLAQCKLHPE